MAELSNPMGTIVTIDHWNLVDEELRGAMIAALCCVVPYLCEYITNASTPFLSRLNI